MKSILVVDDMAIFRDPIAASLRLAGYHTLCAANGEDALQITRENHPALILLDGSMPKMDGLTFLKHLRADPFIATTPVILLTALAEKKYVISAAQFGVKDYLLKSRFRLQDLLDRVKKFEVAAGPESAAVPATISAVSKTESASPSADPGSIPNPTPGLPQSAPVEIKRVLTTDAFHAKLNQVFHAKSLSGVVSQVIALASSGRGDVSDLAGLIARDPVLSARVLQTANSASYASSSAAVATIPNAIKKVGSKVIRNIAAALAVFDSMPDTGADGFNPIRCWQHSFAVAQLCERLASAHMPEQCGVAYLVGLCHDLGDIFVRTQYGKEYQQVTAAAASTGRSWAELHDEMLGMTPAQMIDAVLKSVGLPEEICDPIRIQHSPLASTTTNPIAAILWMAENFANAAMLASSPTSTVAPLTRTFCRSAVADDNPPKPNPSVLRSEVQSLTVALARLSRADEAKLLAPMFQSGKTRIGLVRSMNFSRFDPIELALESLTKVEIFSRLPAAGELQQIEGLVLLAPSPDAPGFAEQAIDAVVANARSGGRPFPVLAIAGERPRSAQGNGPAWHTSASLSDLAAFVQGIGTSNSKTLAA